MHDIDDDVAEDAWDLDNVQDTVLEDAILEDAAATWHMNRRASKQQGHFKTSQASSGTPKSLLDTTSSERSCTSSSSSLVPWAQLQHLEDVAAGELPQISKLLHDNPPCSGQSGTIKHCFAGHSMWVCSWLLTRASDCLPADDSAWLILPISSLKV